MARRGYSDNIKGDGHMVADLGDTVCRQLRAACLRLVRRRGVAGSEPLVLDTALFCLNK